MLAFRQVVALTMKLHSAMMLFGDESSPAERVREQLAGHVEKLSQDQQHAIGELNELLLGFAERTKKL